MTVTLSVLGVDPGETIGLYCIRQYAAGYYDGYPIPSGSWQTALQYIRGARWSRIAIEEWRLWDDSALVGSDLLTVQIIGMIKEIAYQADIPVEQHPQSIKDPAWRYLTKLGIELIQTNQHNKDAAAQAAWTVRGINYNRKGTTRGD